MSKFEKQLLYTVGATIASLGILALAKGDTMLLTPFDVYMSGGISFVMSFLAVSK